MPISSQALAFIVGLAGIVSGAVSLLPLKTTETFVVVVVDKETGEMDRVAACRGPVTRSESDAIIQANLVAYVDDRETFDLSPTVRATDQFRAGTL